MGYRKVVLANNEIYHVLNRGVEQRIIFSSKREYQRTITAIYYYHFRNLPFQLARALLLETKERQRFFEELKKDGEKLVEIICFCLMPNHFHLLLKQKLRNGIIKFVSNLSNSYTRYFNTRHKRIGPLFQGPFKAVRIENDEQLKHISRYIHLNPVASYLIEENELDTYPWSSLPEYLNRPEQIEICEKDIILGSFSSRNHYHKFVHDRVEYAKELEKIKHLQIEK